MSLRKYPHYRIACCLPHLSTVAHNCHGKGINLIAKRKTSPQKEKDSKQKENLTAKLLQYGEDISYFFCREVMVILFAVRLFFLP